MPGRSVLNSNFGGDWYLNNVKFFFSISYGTNSPTILNADQYPVGLLSSNISGQMPFDNTYFGRYYLKWTGVAAFSSGSSFGVIVYGGGNGVYGISPADKGIYQGNPAWINTGSQNCEFSWGTLATSVSSMGGWVKFGVTTNFAGSLGFGSTNIALSSLVGNGTTATATTAAPHGFPTGTTIVMNILGNTPGTFNGFTVVCTITGASTFTFPSSVNATATVAGTYAPYSTTCQFNNITGIASATSFKIWQSDASNILLDNSAAYVGLIGITATGGPGVQTEIIVAPGNISCSLPQNLPVYGVITYAFSNFAIFKKSELASFNAGYQISQKAIDFLLAYQPGYIRYMDALSAQSFYSDFNYRMTANNLSFNPAPGAAPRIVVPSLLVAMSGTGDAIQLVNPGYQTGAYVDGEIVQWVCTNSSISYAPTIQLGARGIVPLISDHWYPLNLKLTGSVTNGDVITLTFTAAYLPGGVRVFTYTVNTGANGPGGVADTSINNLNINLGAALNLDPVLLAYGFQCSNDSGVTGITYQPSNGPVSVTSSTSGAGTEVCHPGTFQVTTGQVLGEFNTAIYNGILKGFVQIGKSTSALSGGLPTGIPLEVIKELSVRGNTGAWFAMPLPYTAASYYALGAWACNNLGSRKVIVEFTNEIWNTFAHPWGEVSILGQCLGWPGPNYFFCAGYSYYGLQVAQLLPYFASGYTDAGGLRSNVFITNQGRADDLSGNASNGCTKTYRHNGASLAANMQSFSGSISGTTLTVPASDEALIAPGIVITGAGVAANTRIVKQLTNASPAGPCRGGTYQVTISQTVGPVTMTPTNPAFAAAGGIGGTPTSASYNVFPNRPADICDSMGYAWYPNGGLISDVGRSYFTGASSAFNALFDAAQKYVSGSDIPGALQWIDDDYVLGINKNGVYNSYSLSGFTNQHANPGQIQYWENQMAVFDGTRPSGKANISCHQYEGNNQQALGTSPQGSVDIINTPGELVTQFNSNGWTLFPTYGATNLEVATNIVKLFLAYRVSNNYYNTTLKFLNDVSAIHAARPFFSPAQFGIEGQGSWKTASIGCPVWGLFSGDLSSQELSNGLAFATFNAANRVFVLNA